MQENIDQRVNAGNNPGMYYEPSDGHSGPVEDDNNNIMTRGAGYYYQKQRPALIASGTHLRPFTTNSHPVRWNPYMSGNYMQFY